jgi:NADH dehydrogenase [ubiquinone] 1 alpha subcomplex assembly factor 5
MNTSPTQTPPVIFNTRRKQSVLNRAVDRGITGSFLWQQMADDLTERLSAVTRDFGNVLFVGPIGYFAPQILGNSKAKPSFAAVCQAELRCGNRLLIDEDNLPFEKESFDLIISAGTLDSVNDLPGALIQFRRTLVPDGLLLATLFGSGTLRALRMAMLAADGPGVSAHIHPQIELRSAADLLSRTGFALAVADIDYITVRYSALWNLIADLRDSGQTSKFAGKRPFLGRQYFVRLLKAWQEMADPDDKVSEQFAFISVSGWAPSPSQPKPAQRGSGKISLADALKPKSA